MRVSNQSVTCCVSSALRARSGGRPDHVAMIGAASIRSLSGAGSYSVATTLTARELALVTLDGFVDRFERLTNLRQEL